MKQASAIPVNPLSHFKIIMNRTALFLDGESVAPQMNDRTQEGMPKSECFFDSSSTHYRAVWKVNMTGGGSEAAQWLNHYVPPLPHPSGSGSSPGGGRDFRCGMSMRYPVVRNPR